MKCKLIVCALCLVFLLTGGCARQQSKVSYIGADKAKQLALEDCGLTTANVDVITADLSTRNDIDYYQIDFTSAGQNYQYCIDAVTGIVIDSQNASGSQDTSPGHSNTPATQNGADTAAVLGDVTDTKTQANSDASSTEPRLLSVEEAKAKALTHAGLTADQVTFLKEELDKENGADVYEIEFCTADNNEYDYEINACTGDVISYDYDAENQIGSQSNGSAISIDEAKQLVLSRIPGATHSNICKFETHHEDGSLLYEGEIIYDDMEYEFEIDAYSGTCRSWEAERHYGHDSELYHD